MEANMIPFRHPGQERRRLSIFVAVLATLALVLAFFVVDGGRNWDRVHRFFSYGTEQVQISMDTAPGALGELDGRLVTAGAEGVTLYDKDGKVSFLAAASLTSPVVQGTAVIFWPMTQGEHHSAPGRERGGPVGREPSWPGIRCRPDGGWIPLLCIRWQRSEI